MNVRGRAVIRAFGHVLATLLDLLFQMTWVGYGGGSALIESIAFVQQILQGKLISFASWMLMPGIAATTLFLLLSFVPGRFGRLMLIGSLAATAWVIFVAASTPGGSLLVLASSIPFVVAGGIGWIRFERFPKPIRVAGACTRCGYSLSGLAPGAAFPECGQWGDV